MIVVAIIAILAAIALPAYQSYIREARFADLQTAAAGLKTNVEVCFAKKGDLEVCDDATELGISFPVATNNYGVPTIDTATANQVIIKVAGTTAVGSKNCWAKGVVQGTGSVVWSYSTDGGTKYYTVGCKYTYEATDTAA